MSAHAASSPSLPGMPLFTEQEESLPKFTEQPMPNHDPSALAVVRGGGSWPAVVHGAKNLLTEPVCIPLDNLHNASYTEPGNDGDGAA